MTGADVRLDLGGGPARPRGAVPPAIRAFVEAGMSIWLDDLSRDRIRSGDLPRLVEERLVSGITTNPTIFAAAVSGTDAYDEQLAELARSGASPEEAAFAVTTDDVAAAADVLAPLHAATGGRDGWVSIEVGASAAHDSAATLDEARRLAAAVARSNVFVKIPATRAGLPAITGALAEGIPVNVTLVFSLQRYREVLDGFLAGLEQALEQGRDLGAIRSVASFFVSRVDSAVDARLQALGSSAALALRGRVAVAGCRIAAAIHAETFASPRAQRLLAAGATPQRLLWASTGVKDEAMRDTRYLEELVLPGAISTMPAATLEALVDHGRITGDTVTGRAAQARDVLERLAEAGVSLDEITAELERDGVARFARSGEELLATVASALERPDGAA
ncbi:transaldolase [Amnibacterium sp. CER49]|uniref:transaldolase n=1 Tax=Amnibacterium sp. CER49 TaxID=3039161 RepID=UPI00244886BD|nr:transaldolase [Amnibacterium sp. CER49]MDH2444162.1 transaldolase [Amnibacterium sp. CER49]